MIEFGSDLRREREARGVSLDDIAQGTKVSVRYLHALEAAQFSELPGGVFNKGILRAYVRFLGLDETQWMERFDRLPGVSQSEADWSTFAENVRRNRTAGRRERDLRWLGIAVMVMVLAACGWLVWRYVVQPRMEAAPVSDVEHGQRSAL